MSDTPETYRQRRSRVRAFLQENLRKAVVDLRRLSTAGVVASDSVLREAADMLQLNEVGDLNVIRSMTTDILMDLWLSETDNAISRAIDVVVVTQQGQPLPVVQSTRTEKELTLIVQCPS